MSLGASRLRELLEQLVAGDVRFVLVGGLAVGAWGHVRGTKDVDIVPDPDADNLEHLATLLAELEGRVISGGRALETSAIRVFLRAGDKTLVRTKLGDVDVLQGLPQVPRFDDLASRAEEVDFEGLQVLICSMDDLLTMKRAADRPQDRLDIEALETAHGQDEE